MNGTVTIRSARPTQQSNQIVEGARPQASELGRVSSSEAEARYEAKREAAPALVVALLVLVALAVVSLMEGWELLDRVPGWVWFLLAVPELILLIDLLLATRGAGPIQTRRVALWLLRVLVLGNLAAVAILVAGLVTASTTKLGGGELLLTAFALLVTNVIVFGLWYWEVDDGGPVVRARRPRATPDFQFPQDENPQLAPGWKPQAWDYIYLSLTNSIAFSPTDAMPLTRHAKSLMALESVISITVVVLVTARAVNVLGS
jgi:uncharacterized membrane protein